MRPLIIAATLLGALACGVPQPGEEQQTQPAPQTQSKAPDDAQSTSQALCWGSYTESFCASWTPCNPRNAHYHYAQTYSGGSCVWYIESVTCGTSVCG